MATTVQQFMQQNPGYTGQANTANRTAAKSPYAKGVGGVFEHLLPAIGSIVGGVGGTFIAPGVGTAVGGASGAVVGQKAQDWLTGQHTSGKGYAEQAALGTLGGIGKGLGAVKGATQALRAGEDLGTAGNVLRYGQKGAAAVGPGGGGGLAANSVIANNANSGKSLLSSMVGKQASNVGKQAMMAQAQGLGKRTAESAVRDLSDLRTMGYTGFNKAAEHAPLITGDNGILTQTRNAMLNSSKAKPVATSDFMGNVQNVLDNHTLTNAEEKTVMGKVTKIANKYNFHGDQNGIGVTSPANFNGAMKDINTLGYNANRDSSIRKALVELGNSMRPQLADSLSSVPLTTATKGQIFGGLREAGVNNPGLIKAIRGSNTAADLSNIESKFVTASNVAKDVAENNMRGGVLGSAAKPTATNMANQLVGRGIEKTASKGGSMIENMIGRGKPAISSTAPGVAAQSAKSMAKGQVIGRGLFSYLNKTNQSNQGTPQTNSSTTPLTDALSGQTSPSDNTANSPFTSENIQNAILKDIAATGGKHITELNALYNTFGSPKAQNTLSTSEQTRHDSLNSALSALDASQQLLGSSGGAKGAVVGQLAKIPLFGQYLNNSGVAYEKTKTDTAAQLTKAVTGSSRVNQSVFEGFMHSLPDVTDTPAQASAKIKDLRVLMTAQAKRFGFNDLTQ